LLNFDKLIIEDNKTIKEALIKIDQGAKKNVFVVNSENEMIGMISDGDIRRWILKNGDLYDKIDRIINRNPKFIYVTDGWDDAKDLMLKYSIDIIPVIDEEKHISNIIVWEDLFKKGEKQVLKKINLRVVIMAGGKGTRLDPFTRVLPKPLIPLGDKPIIEVIMDKFAEFGMTSFFISVNHKAKMIKAYFEDCNADYSISYIDEDKPLGTAGALKFLSGKIDTPFFVSNCDVLVKDNYAEIYEFHKKGKFDLTIVASMQHHTIPYRVCAIGENGNLKQITENPQYDFLVNTGMYVLEPSVLKFIPENTFFHITDLIGVLQQNNMKVGVYPVSEQSWIDIGQLDEYKKHFDMFNNHDEHT